MIGEGLQADGVLVHAPAPLGTFWFPLHSGLTVVYGRNGAGKTRVLSAVASALRGVRLPEGEVSVHLSLVADFNGWDYSLLAAFIDSIADDWDADDGLETDDVIEDSVDDFLVDLVGHQRRSRSAKAMLDELAESDDDQIEQRLSQMTAALRDYVRSVAEKFGLNEGLCHTPRLSLVAIGTEEHPMWNAYISVIPTEVSSFVDRFRSGNVSAPWSGDIGEPFNINHLRNGSGWREGPLPVNVRAIQLRNPQEYGDGRDEGFAAAGVILCLVATVSNNLTNTTVELLRDVAFKASGQDGLIASMDLDSFEPIDAVAATLQTLSSGATMILRGLTAVAGSLRAELVHPNRWHSGEILKWVGTDPYGVELPIEQLGTGTNRWAVLAISLALSNVDFFHPAVLIVDEPERALHGAAQLDVAASFANIVQGNELGAVAIEAAIVATHSAAFLALSDAELVHVSRDSQLNLALEPIDTTISVEGLTAMLGISRSDALLTVRWFIFVEGAHDAAVLSAVFADEFRRTHSIVRDISGAKNLRVSVNAQMLFAYTDARFRFVVDSVGAEATEAWRSAVEAAEASKKRAAREILEKLGQRRERETTWLRDMGHQPGSAWARRADQHQRRSRPPHRRRLDGQLRRHLRSVAAGHRPVRQSRPDLVCIVTVDDGRPVLRPVRSVARGRRP